MATLTDKTILKALREAKAADTDIWLTDQTKARGVGRLRLRARPTGGIWYFRYSNPQGKQEQLVIGAYDGADVSGLGLKSARGKAGELSQLYQAGHRDLRGFLEHRQAEEHSARETAAKEREEAERKAVSGSLKSLCDGYVSHLEKQGKKSARAVANTFSKHLYGAFPELAARRAREITHKDINIVLARLLEDEKGRTAGKLRSYLAAAFSAALQAESDPTIPAALHGFELTANPAAVVSAKALAKYNRARERVLSEGELQAFLEALSAYPGQYADAVILLLLLGGQRPTQMLRARPADVDLDGGTITLFDGKGARQNPRVHVLPLTERAAGIVKKHVDSDRAYLFSLHGKAPVHADTLSKFVTGISREMVEKKTARELFQLRDLRRTCETLLAAMGVSRDVRAQLLSHGLSGVQQKHYDRHEYMAEKRQVLEAWDRRLNEITSGEKSGNVVALRG